MLELTVNVGRDQPYDLGDGYNHMAPVVDDLDALLESLAAHGIEPEKPPYRTLRVTRLTIQHAGSVAALMLTAEALVAEEQLAQPGAIIAPGFGDLADGLGRPSSPV